ncbi:hypothetical protein [Polynucleobacter sp. AP-Ainpum-60-G11]|uniref:hypothetical protein n=1 Tax=Polynucleobacter sp. AP-Ainpum-60-G11 TaxID=2576926 RepID=UPI001BFDD80A|nr:hypothetical protein [Polynucleobacter sp. AP-Ainpum-60-G11]QWE27024.1 hypothetical protein FD971_01680 [Polynucleobacter sp. AP-Ainpum-60-G11]
MGRKKFTYDINIRSVLNSRYEYQLIFSSYIMAFYILVSSFLFILDFKNNYFNLFIDPVLIILFFFIINKDRGNKILLRFSAFIILFKTLDGSRSAILSLIFICLILNRDLAFFSLNAKVKRNMIIIFLAGILLYFIGGFLRGQSFFENPILIYIYWIAQRFGELDATVLILNDVANYSKIINFNYYINSVVDGLIIGSLSGVETLRASIALKSVYLGVDISEVPLLPYSSDWITMYADAYILFGKYYLIALTIIGYTFTKAYIYSMRISNTALSILLTIIVLYSFMGFLNGWGFDWEIQRIIKLITLSIFTIALSFLISPILKNSIKKIS